MSYPSYSDLELEIQNLEQDNKYRKNEVKKLKNKLKSKTEVIRYYRKEKQKLQIEIWWLMWERDWLKMVVEKLHKEIEDLENSRG